MNMRFKGFTWPNNPRTYTIGCERRTAVQKLPLGSFVVQDLGPTCMVLRGEGEFFGAGAMEAFQELMAVFSQGDSGMLAHPAWPCAQAVFTRLQLTQEPREDYVAYSFEFCEATPNERPGAAAPAQVSQGRQYHTIEGGQTLWSVCSLYGLTMGALTALNPAIPRPTGLKVGQKVRVA